MGLMPSLEEIERPITGNNMVIMSDRGLILVSLSTMYPKLMYDATLHITNKEDIPKKKKKRALVVDVQGPREPWEFTRGNWEGPLHVERDRFQQKPPKPKPDYYRNDYHQRGKNNRVNQPRQSHKSYKARNGL